MNRKQDTARAGMLAGVEAGHQQAKLDKALAADALHAAEVALVPLAAVLDRVGNLDTRQPTPEAVAALAASVAALGLLEPLVVDKLGRLLAGKTRLLALRQLAATAPDRWAKVPVRRMDFDAEADTGRALAVEVAENEQRRDYTAAEVRGLAERLKAAGFRDTPGRPGHGSKALVPALGAVVGKSASTVRRLLGKKDAGEKLGQMATFPEACARLRRALLAFDRAAGDVALADMTTTERRAVKDAAALAELLATIAERKHNAAH